MITNWNDTESLLDFFQSFGLDIEPSSQVCISDDRTGKERECTYLEEEFHKMIGTSSHSRRMKFDLDQNLEIEELKNKFSWMHHRLFIEIQTELQQSYN